MPSELGVDVSVDCDGKNEGESAKERDKSEHGGDNVRGREDDVLESTDGREILWVVMR